MFKIPQIQNLVDQTYKENQVEFTWRLPFQDQPTLQVVMEINKKGKVHLFQNRMVKQDDDFVPEDDPEIDLTFNTLRLFKKNLNQLPSEEYEKLTMNDGLVKLAENVVEYLK